jgi:hypothetical protein
MKYLVSFIHISMAVPTKIETTPEVITLVAIEIVSRELIHSDCVCVARNTRCSSASIQEFTEIFATLHEPNVNTTRRRCAGSEGEPKTTVHH